MSSKKKKQAQAVKEESTDFSKFAYPLLILLGIMFYYYTQSMSFIQDDSFITYRYVKNFTEGNGLVFNIGERVEGYTCFLWVILLSAVKSLGFNFISFSQTLGVIFSMITLLFTFNISDRIFPKGKDSFYNITFSILAVILLAANGSFAYWAVSGMETGLFTFLVTLGIYLYLRELNKHGSFPYSSIIFLLASLSRPEGNIIFAVTVLHRLIVEIKAAKKNGKSLGSIASKDNLLWLGVYIIPALLYMGWRYSYYGYWFPNTFYAKTGSSLEYYKTGIDYFWEFAKSYGGYGVLIAFTLINLKSKERFYDYLYLILIFFIFSAYIIIVGGDVLRPNRFFVPMLPVFYILIQEGIHQTIYIFEKKNQVSYGPILALVAVIAFAYYNYRGESEQIKRYSELENGLVEKMKISANWLKGKQTAAGRPLVVAATTIGAISYYSEVMLIDMLGLTDKEISHNPKPIQEISSNSEIGWKERHYNVDYVLSRKPDYIYFSTGIKPSAYAERGLFTSGEFLKYYFPTYFTVKELNFSDAIYKRKSDDAVKNITEIQPNPNYKKSFVNLYNQAMNTQKDKTKTQEAIGLFQQAADQGPSNWGTPYQMIGDLYMQNKNKEKAFEYYKKAVELDDYVMLAHYSLYQLYMEKGDTVNAKINLEKIQKYSPEMLK
jgi:arabinofuranosyltransferase